MAGTILRLGWSDPLTDTFGAHPLLGDVVDLNDGVTFTLLDGALELEPPPHEMALAGNVRSQGERATRAMYRHNRQARIQLALGPMASYGDLISNVRALVRWLDAAPATPFCVQWQPPSATSPVYLDVVGAAHGIPADEREWLRLQLEPIEIVFLVRPGLRGDRVTLSNLVVNPGFEAPSGPGVNVFNDNLGTANAYSVMFGSAATASGNILTVPANSQASFGSLSWGAINQWTVRFQWASTLVAVFSLHEVDINNRLSAQLDGVNIIWNQLTSNNAHNLSSTPFAPTNGTWYWITLTQFPSAPGTVPDVQATIFADSAGSLGAQITTTGPVALVDAVTATTGKPSIGASNVAMNVGGNFPNVHTLSLFGPGGWTTNGGYGSPTGLTSMAWEQNTSNTYSGGAVTSFAAARMDFPPVGTVSASWEQWAGGSPAGSSAIPTATGQTMAASVWVKSSGLSGTASLSLQLREWDAGGALLRTTALGSNLSGNHPAWSNLSGTLVMGVSTAFCSLALVASDPTTGASANGTVWWDNAQCWNVTTTGQASMPYCELRFPQSPAQLLLTGLLGDLPAPAFFAWGTYLASWNTGSTLSYAIGRRAQASANARMVGASIGYYGSGVSPQSTAVADAGSYSGYYAQALVNPSWNPRAFSFAPADLLGVYHLFSRFYSTQSAGNIGNLETRVVTQQKTGAWYGSLTNTDQVGAYNGPFVFPISASATWTPADSGQVNVPALPSGALTDLTQTFLTPRAQWGDITSGGSTCRCNWQMLLPIDGSLLVGIVNNPSNAPFNVTTSWLWVYHDALLLNRAAIGDGASATYSVESLPKPAPAHGGGGPGTSSTGVINVNSGADPALVLDPSVSVAATSTAAGGNGVNQLAGYVADGSGTVLSLHAEIQYSPLYLYPR
ncbi:MAG TPA: hypothetical protein VE338_01165 [Ktedonobacterales bacterium]|jgi:hypothetical protein|nr:hypothetical protein [Ktedonobacterales bacterium]